MQAIITTLRNGTNGNAYFFAKADAGSLRVACDHSLSLSERHLDAAQRLMTKLGWDADGMRIDGSGSMPGKQGDVFVHTVAPKGETLDLTGATLHRGDHSIVVTYNSPRDRDAAWRALGIE